MVKENNFNKDVKIKKYAAVQLRISLRGKFFMSHWARLQKNKPWDEKHEREVSPPASEYKRETLRSSGASYKSVEM